MQNALFTFLQDQGQDPVAVQEFRAELKNLTAGRAKEVQ